VDPWPLTVVPLRMLPFSAVGCRYFSWPRWSVSSSSNAVSSTVAVIAFSSPSGPVRSSPRARAAVTSSRTAVRSVWPSETVVLACVGIELTPVIFSVII
jgi:hypothetical protein